LPPNSRRATSPICPDLIYDRHRLPPPWYSGRACNCRSCSLSGRHCRLRHRAFGISAVRWYVADVSDHSGTSNA
jgi:hypothetical protein